MTIHRAQRWRGPERFASAMAALMVTLIIGYALVIGLKVPPLLRELADDSPLSLFDLKAPLPDPPEASSPVRQRAIQPRGGNPPAPARPRPDMKEDSPPPAPAVAPPPLVPTPQPIAPSSASSVGTGAGAAQGTGSPGTGGQGDGSGSGGSGQGAGSGEGDGGRFSRARQTGGRFRNSDFPQSARGAGRLKIGVRYAIGPSGHVDTCEIIETSGYADVDAMTCRIIIERYRFRPARDPDGYAVTEVREEDYRWRVR